MEAGSAEQARIVNITDAHRMQHKLYSRVRVLHYRALHTNTHIIPFLPKGNFFFRPQENTSDLDQVYVYLSCPGRQFNP